MSRLERWSRLKRGELPASSAAPLSQREGETQEHEASDRTPLDTDPCARASRSSDSPAPGSLDHTLPDPDTLPAGSDIKAYLASGVSAGLRKRALRRLFAAEHYGVRDGLDDYDDDYRQKLQPLASEVAERLRNWTRQKAEDDGQIQDAHDPEIAKASHPDAEPAETEQAGAEDDAAMVTGEEDDEPSDTERYPPGAS